jgi:hypothetical protein
MAVLGVYQRFILAYAASINTTTVSIPLPNAKINEKLVIKLSVSHNHCNTPKVIKNEQIIAIVAINACLKPINNAVITNTINTDCQPLFASDL